MSWKKIAIDCRQKNAHIEGEPVSCLIIDADYWTRYRLLISSKEKVDGAYITHWDRNYNSVKEAQQACDAVLFTKNEEYNYNAELQPVSSKPTV